MKFIYQWVPGFCCPPRWMAFAYYSARRNRQLFVVPPINLVIAGLWWLQDKWAFHAQSTSWIENEVRFRMQQACRQPGRDRTLQ